MPQIITAENPHQPKFKERVEVLARFYAFAEQSIKDEKHQGEQKQKQVSLKVIDALMWLKINLDKVEECYVKWKRNEIKVDEKAIGDGPSLVRFGSKDGVPLHLEYYESVKNCKQRLTELYQTADAAIAKAEKDNCLPNLLTTLYNGCCLESYSRGMSRYAADLFVEYKRLNDVFTAEFETIEMEDRSDLEKMFPRFAKYLGERVQTENEVKTNPSESKDANKNLKEKPYRYISWDDISNYFVNLTSLFEKEDYDKHQQNHASFYNQLFDLRTRIIDRARESLDLTAITTALKDIGLKPDGSNLNTATIEMLKQDNNHDEVDLLVLSLAWAGQWNLIQMIMDHFPGKIPCDRTDTVTGDNALYRIMNAISAAKSAPNQQAKVDNLTRLAWSLVARGANSFACNELNLSPLSEAILQKNYTLTDFMLNNYFPPEKEEKNAGYAQTKKEEFIHNALKGLLQHPYHQTEIEKNFLKTVIFEYLQHLLKTKQFALIPGFMIYFCNESRMDIRNSILNQLISHKAGAEAIGTFLDSGLSYTFNCVDPSGCCMPRQLLPVLTEISRRCPPDYIISWLLRNQSHLPMLFSLTTFKQYLFLVEFLTKKKPDASYNSGIKEHLIFYYSHHKKCDALLSTIKSEEKLSNLHYAGNSWLQMLLGEDVLSAEKELEITTFLGEVSQIPHCRNWLAQTLMHSTVQNQTVLDIAMSANYLGIVNQLLMLTDSLKLPLNNVIRNPESLRNFLKHLAPNSILDSDFILLHHHAMKNNAHPLQRDQKLTPMECAFRFMNQGVFEAFCKDYQRERDISLATEVKALVGNQRWKEIGSLLHEEKQNSDENRFLFLGLQRSIQNKEQIFVNWGLRCKKPGSSYNIFELAMIQNNHPFVDLVLANFPLPLLSKIGASGLLKEYCQRRGKLSPLLPANLLKLAALQKVLSLKEAIRSQHTEVIDIVVRDEQKPDGIFATALIEAIHAEDWDTTTWLLNQRYEFSLVIVKPENAKLLDVIFKSTKISPVIKSQLIQNFIAKFKDNETLEVALFLAAKRQCWTQLHDLNSEFKHEFKEEKNSRKFDESLNNWLHLMASHAQIEKQLGASVGIFVEKLLRSRREYFLGLMADKNNNGETPLDIALNSNNSPLLTALARQLPSSSFDLAFLSRCIQKQLWSVVSVLIHREDLKFLVNQTDLEEIILHKKWDIARSILQNTRYEKPSPLAADYQVQFEPLINRVTLEKQFDLAYLLRDPHKLTEKTNAIFDKLKECFKKREANNISFVQIRTLVVLALQNRRNTLSRELQAPSRFAKFFSCFGNRQTSVKGAKVRELDNLIRLLSDEDCKFNIALGLLNDAQENQSLCKGFLSRRTKALITTLRDVVQMIPANNRGLEQAPQAREEKLSLA